MGLRTRAVWRRCLVCLLLGLVVIACSSPIPVPNPFSPTPTPTYTPTATPTPVPQNPTPPEGTSTPEVIDLTWWTPAWFSPQSQDPAGELLAQRLAEFESTHPGIRVHVFPKPAAGKASVSRYLQSAYKVAPSLLPDVAVVDMQDLPTLSALGIFQPLQDTLSPDVVEDVYDFALQVGKMGEDMLLVQFVVDFYHMAYSPEKVTTPPATWETLLNSDVPYFTWVFSSEDDISDVVLLQYVAAGGDLPDQEPAPLDEQALLSLFNFYSQGLARGIFPPESFVPLSPDRVWDAVQKGESPMGDVAARDYAREGLQEVNLAAAPIPMWDGKPRALTRGWGIGITTADPQRQEAALALIQWLLAPQTLGTWSQLAGHVPTRRSALALWTAPPPYKEMIGTTLESAIPYPHHASVIDLRQALAAGLRDLAEEGVSPEEAVRRVRDAYTP